MAQTWINGFFFEYDDSSLDTGKASRIQYSVKTDLASEPITREFFKLHANIYDSLDDTLCDAYIKAGRQELEKLAQLSFGDKTMLLKAKELPIEYRLLYGPVLSIVSPADGYSLLGDTITFDEVQKDITVEYTVGWGATGLPEALEIAVAQAAAGRYYQRENLVVEYAAILDQAKATVKKYRNEYFL